MLGLWCLSHSGAKHQKSEHYSCLFSRLQEGTLNLSENLQNRKLSRYLHIQKIYVSKSTFSRNHVLKVPKELIIDVINREKSILPLE